jgi:gamma-tubulin complex component 3
LYTTTATDAKNSTGKASANAAHRALTMADVLGTIVTPTVQHTLQNLRYGGEAQLQDIVYQLSAGIDAKLLNLVMSRFYVQTHLLALKKFMLLGQGDFVTCLMDGVGPELKRRANQLFRHNLTGILEGALRASNAQFEPSYVLDRIGIRLLEASAGDSGWEIFSLDYAIDAPLNTVSVDCRRLDGCVMVFLDD